MIVGVTTMIPYSIRLSVLYRDRNFHHTSDYRIILCTLVFALQQFDGNILGTADSGDKLGLPLVSAFPLVCVGGGLFVHGVYRCTMLAVIYMGGKEFVNYQAKEKENDLGEYFQRNEKKEALEIEERMGALKNKGKGYCVQQAPLFFWEIMLKTDRCRYMKNKGTGFG